MTQTQTQTPTSLPQVRERAAGSWTGSFDGAGILELEERKLPLSLPRSMRGTGEGINPEQLLAAASASCLMVTLGIILDKAKVPYVAIHSEGEVALTAALPPTVESIALTLVVETDEPLSRILPLAETAKKMCVIGRALNPEIETQLRVTVSQARQAPLASTPRKSV